MEAQDRKLFSPCIEVITPRIIHEVIKPRQEFKSYLEAVVSRGSTWKPKRLKGSRNMGPIPVQ